MFTHLCHSCNKPITYPEGMHPGPDCRECVQAMRDTEAQAEIAKIAMSALLNSGTDVEKLRSSDIVGYAWDLADEFQRKKQDVLTHLQMPGDGGEVNE